MKKSNKSSSQTVTAPSLTGRAGGESESLEAIRTEELKALHLSGVEGICIDDIPLGYITSMLLDVKKYYEAMARAKKPMKDANKALEAIRTKATALTKDGRAYFYSEKPEEYGEEFQMTPGGLLLDICRERSTCRLDVTRLRAEHPEIYEEYAVSGTSAAPLRMASQMVKVIEKLKG